MMDEVIRELFTDNVNPNLDIDTAMQDFTKQLSNAVNAFYLEEKAKEQERKEKELEAKKRKEEEELKRKQEEEESERARKGLIDNLVAAIDTNHFDYKVAAAASTLAFIGENEEKPRREAIDEIYREFQRLLQEKGSTLRSGSRSGKTAEDRSGSTSVKYRPDPHTVTTTLGRAVREASDSVSALNRLWDQDQINKFLRSFIE